MKDLDWIKKYYGEEFMHKCRSWFATILAHPGELKKILSENFAENKDLCDDLTHYNQIEEFKDYIKTIYIKGKEKNKNLENEYSNENSNSLMQKAGYKTFKLCETEEEIQNFRHFYKRKLGQTPKYIPGTTPEPYSGEELCTFDGDRLETNYVYFAVKENIEKYERKDYPLPGEDFTSIGGKKFDDVKDEYAHKFFPNKNYDELTKKEKIKVLRDNDYGTSVISIQISKSFSHSVSIKNRYNHSLPDEVNPDATFDNDLSNIHIQLKRKLEEELNIKIESIVDSAIDMFYYVQSNTGKYYKYNNIIFNNYYCPNNVIIKEYKNYKVKEFNSEQYIISDTGIVFNLKEKTVSNYDKLSKESLPSTLVDIKNFNVSLDKKTGIKTLLISFKDKERKDVIIKFNKNNCIIEINDPNLKIMPENYLNRASFIKNLSFENLKIMNTNCFSYSYELESLNLNNLKIMRDNCFRIVAKLTKLNLPKLEEMGIDCFNYASSLLEANCPMLKIAEKNCFSTVTLLKKYDFTKLKYIKDNFFSVCNSIEEAIFPNATYMGNGCFKESKRLKKVILEKVKEIGCNCFYDSPNLEEFSCPNVKYIDNRVCVNSSLISELNCEKLTMACNTSFANNPKIRAKIEEIVYKNTHKESQAETDLNTTKVNDLINYTKQKQNTIENNLPNK